jgi:hypothetical protein
VESSVRGPDIAGYGSGSGNVGLFEVNIVSNEEAAGADSGGPSSLVKFGTTNIGTPGGVTASGIAETFELAFTNILEKDSVRPGCSGSIVIDGNTVATPDKEPCLSSEDGAFGQRGTADRNKGDNVRGADARMDTVLLSEVNEFGSLTRGTYGGFDDGLWRTRDGDNRTVMRRVKGPVQKTDALDLHGRDDLGNFGYVRAFGKVGDTLDDGFWVHICL